MAEDEEILWDFCSELLHNKRSCQRSDVCPRPCEIRRSGVVEAASLEGYYTYLSMVMNTARSPPAVHVKPPLALFPK